MEIQINHEHHPHYDLHQNLINGIINDNIDLVKHAIDFSIAAKIDIINIYYKCTYPKFPTVFKPSHVIQFDVHSKTIFGAFYKHVTPLCLAILFNRLNIVEYLLTVGNADINLPANVCEINMLFRKFHFIRNVSELELSQKQESQISKRIKIPRKYVLERTTDRNYKFRDLNYIHNVYNLFSQDIIKLYHPIFIAIFLNHFEILHYLIDYGNRNKTLYIPLFQIHLVPNVQKPYINQDNNMTVFYNEQFDNNIFEYCYSNKIFFRKQNRTVFERQYNINIPEYSTALYDNITIQMHLMIYHEYEKKPSIEKIKDTRTIYGMMFSIVLKYLLNKNAYNEIIRIFDYILQISEFIWPSKKLVAYELKKIVENTLEYIISYPNRFKCNEQFVHFINYMQTKLIDDHKNAWYDFEYESGEQIIDKKFMTLQLYGLKQIKVSPTPMFELLQSRLTQNQMQKAFSNIINCNNSGKKISRVVYFMKKYPNIGTPNHLLFYAIENASVDLVKLALKLGANPNGIQHHSMTSFREKYGDVNINFHVLNNMFGASALTQTLYNFSQSSNIKYIAILKLLIKYKCNFNSHEISCWLNGVQLYLLTISEHTYINISNHAFSTLFHYVCIFSKLSRDEIIRQFNLLQIYVLKPSEFFTQSQVLEYNFKKYYKHQHSTLDPIFVKKQIISLSEYKKFIRYALLKRIVRICFRK